MPRAQRFSIENGLYHVMNRGAARRHIFVDDSLKSLFLGILEEVSYKYRFQVICYCIMGNHYHLLIRTEDANLSEGMRFLNSRYARQFNRLRLKDGPIFRSRFQSILISDDRYLLNVCRYIHLNPVEAGIVKRPEDYPWSNYAYFLMSPQISHLQLQDYKQFVEAGNSQFILDFYRKIYLKKKL
jgi:putative transposase